jgi:hypothetical protein
VAFAWNGAAAKAAGNAHVCAPPGALAIQEFTGFGEEGAIHMNNRGTKRHAKSVALAAALAAGTIGYAHAADMPVKAPPPAPPFFFVNDTSVSYTYFPTATDPGVSGSSGITPGGIPFQPNSIGRSQFSIDHFDVWQYGTNLIHGEFNQYGGQDPNQGIPGSNGARELFGFWTGTLGFNEISGTKAFSNLLTKDVSLMLNLTGGVENNFLSPETTQVAPGIQFTLNLPGVVNVGITAYKEWSHNSYEACGNNGFGVANTYWIVDGGACPGAAGESFSGDRNFELTWKLFTFISEPIPSTPLTVVNVLNITGPKGTGISTANLQALGAYGGLAGTPAAGFDTVASQLANNETKTEIFEDVRLSLDTSRVLWGKPGIWDTYVGYRYWYNKFGTDHAAPLFELHAPWSSIERTAYVGTTYHFK